MRFKESLLGQADLGADEGREPVTGVFAIHGSGRWRLFHSNPDSDHRHCRPACQGAAAGTVNCVVRDQSGGGGSSTAGPSCRFRPADESGYAESHTITELVCRYGVVLG